MKKISLSAISSICLISCATARIDKTVAPENLRNLGAFETVSLIQYIEKGNQGRPSDSLSQLSTKILDSIILKSDRPKVDKKFELTGTFKKRTEIDILKTISSLRVAKKNDVIKSTPLMDSVVKSQNERFGLCIVNSGFGRKKGNYGKQIAKGVGIGILTLGMYTPVPIKATTSLYALIFDAESSKVIYYYGFPPIEKSPTDTAQLHELYKGVFNLFYHN